MIKTTDKNQIQRDISESFDFIRFILKNPKMLGKIKDGSQIRFLPAASGKVPSHMPRKVQAFTTETVFHTL